MGWAFWVSNPIRDKIFVSSPIIQTISGVHPSYFSGGAGFFAWGKAAEVRLTTLLHLVARLKNEWSCAFAPRVFLHDVYRGKCFFFPFLF